MKRARVIRLDTNNDGKVDTEIIDEDGDGVGDVVKKDTTGDGSMNSERELARTESLADMEKQASSGHLREVRTEIRSIFEDEESAEMINKLIVAFLESFTMTVIVLTLVCIQIWMIRDEVDSPTFEIFTSIFFTLEVSLKFYALGWRGFFVSKNHGRTKNFVYRLWAINWLNIADLSVVVMDLIVLCLTTFLNIPFLGKYIKSARMARILKVLKFARLFRLLKVLKTVWQVLSRQPNEWVAERRLQATHTMNKMNKSDPMYAFSSDRHRAPWLEGKKAHGDAKTWKAEIAKAREAGDELVRKRVLQTGLPVIGEVGGNKVKFRVGTQKLSEIFGVDVGMYFWSLQMFGVMFLIITVIQTASFLHFASSFRAPQGRESILENTTVLLTGTISSSINGGKHTELLKLIATGNFTQIMIAVQHASTVGKQNLMHGTATCFDNPVVEVLPARGVSTNAGLFLQRHNNCGLAPSLAVTGCLVLVALFVFYVHFQCRFDKMLKKIRVNTQTAASYSVMIEDPNSMKRDDDYHDALLDASVWKEYCETATQEADGEVAGVTIMLDNGDLLDRIAKRQKYAFELKTLELQLKAAVKNPQKLSKRIKKMEELYCTNEFELHAFMQQSYRVSKVFITFNTESAQRYFLKNYSQSRAASMLDMSMDMTQEQRFQQKKILEIHEAPDASSLFYKNIGLATKQRQKVQQLVILACVCLLAYLEYLLIQFFNSLDQAALAGAVIASMNAIVPSVLYFLSSFFEIHETEAQRISALFNKDSLFRYFNTAIIIYLLTPFNEQLNYERLFRVQSILIFDAFLTPLTHLFDVNRYLKRHIIARLTKSHYGLALIFSGDEVRLSERYSTLAKIVFVGLFYLPLLPTGAPLAAISCFLNYVIDKIGLLFRWRWLPRTNGTDLFWSLAVHIGFAILVHTFMAMRFYGGWSYDEVCAFNQTVASALNTNTTLDYGWVKCDKNQWPNFLISSEDWMSDIQRQLVLIYRSSFIIAFAFIVLCMGMTFAQTVKDFFIASYSGSWDLKMIRWNDVPGCRLYVPQFQVVGVKKPFICCDTTFMGTSHIGWGIGGEEDATGKGEGKRTEKVRDASAYDDYNLFVQVKPVIKQLEIEPRRIFSQCVQFVDDNADDPNGISERFKAVADRDISKVKVVRKPKRGVAGQSLAQSMAGKKSMNRMVV